MKDCNIVCDHCKKVENTGHYTSLPVGWKNIEVKFGQYNHKNYDLCPGCLTSMGLVTETNEAKSISEPTTEEKLFSAIYEMVEMAREE